MRSSLIELINWELEARLVDEGCRQEDVADLRERFDALKESGSVQDLEHLYGEVLSLRPIEPRPWEPSGLNEIRKARPDGPRSLPVQLSSDELLNRIYGGWLGRAAGCTLGKPVENWTRAQIETYLRSYGLSNIQSYLPFDESMPVSAEESALYHHPRKHQNCCLGQVRFAPCDDDMDYSVIALDLLKRKGFAFTPKDVGMAWLSKLPYHCTYTAERVAYRNLVLGLTPPETAYYRNPFRQWIGAQIRADVYGYVCPGNPEMAASLAWRDACISHVKNGIYGAMWVAAAIAAAFVSNDIREVITIAATEIPRESRFAGMVADMLAWSEKYSTWQECWEAINAKYGHLNGVHTINNAAMVLLGLLYGDMDFGRTIGIAVQGGLDTDCNGATAGSILGVMLGAKALPSPWIEPLNDTLETPVVGYSYPKFRDLAEQTLGVVLRCTVAGD